ncbi:MAG: precorrin-2 C(20)-methyltransferase [Lachnospiraceae bacterium]
MSGILYGVGVGPGDPKLMTCLAVETIRKSHVLAIPAGSREQAVSYRIAGGMIEHLEEKETLCFAMPMTKNKEILEQHYQMAAEQIAERLEQGKDVAYLTLGDPTVYSTYIYVHRLVVKRGYQAQIINGVPSFCAAAAALGDSLADRGEEIHIIPSSYDVEQALELPGTKILMKAGSRMPTVKKMLQDRGIDGVMVENCGMAEERIYRSIEEIPDQVGYYCLTVLKEQ